MNTKPAHLEKLSDMLMFSKTLHQLAIKGPITDGLRIMSHMHCDDITKVVNEERQHTYLVGAVDLDGEQLLIEVFANGECHIARRAKSWDTWPVGVWFTLEEKNCG